MLIFDPKSEKEVEGREYQERVYSSTDQISRETGVKKNVTHKIPPIHEILMSCDRKIEG